VDLYITRGTDSSREPPLMLAYPGAVSENTMDEEPAQFVLLTS